MVPEGDGNNHASDAALISRLIEEEMVPEGDGNFKRKIKSELTKLRKKWSPKGTETDSTRYDRGRRVNIEEEMVPEGDGNSKGQRYALRKAD